MLGETEVARVDIRTENAFVTGGNHAGTVRMSGFPAHFRLTVRGNLPACRQRAETDTHSFGLA